MVVIGIDIGITGAAAAVDTHGTCSVQDLPITGGVSAKRIDGRALILLLRQFVPPGETATCVIEDVRVRQIRGRQMSHANEGNLMRSRGIVEAVADIMRLDLRVIQPATWKRFYGLLGKDKNAARGMAAKLYPIQSSAFKRVKDHNRAEAVLIAHYGHGRLA
jgi:hypothetical protein